MTRQTILFWTKYSAVSAGGRARDEADLERNAGHLPLVHGDIDCVCAVAGEGELLEIQDEVARREEKILRELNLERGVHGGHNGASIFIHKEDADGVHPFLLLAKEDAESHGTLGVNGGERAGDDGIEGAQEAEFSIVIDSGIAQGGDLNFHV